MASVILSSLTQCLKKQVEWAKDTKSGPRLATLSELQGYVKKVHTTGIVWVTELDIFIVSGLKI
jgi:hypothetical protein